MKVSGEGLGKGIILSEDGLWTVFFGGRAWVERWAGAEGEGLYDAASKYLGKKPWLPPFSGVFPGKISVYKTSAGQRHLDYGNVPTEVSAKSEAQAKVIIMTYMRSGSSFVGELFNHHGQTFYVFEPLFSLEKQSDRAQSAHFLNGTSIRLKRDGWLSSTLPGAYVKSFLGCDFFPLDLVTLRQAFLRRGRSIVRYFNCTRGTTSVHGIQDCLPLLYKACGRADVTVVKTIRFSMAQTTTLMAEDPRIKVIHLVRDPRSTLRSRKMAGRRFFAGRPSESARLFCQQVLADLQQAEKMKTLFPGRMLTVRYEDLAMDPLVMAQKVLSFVGLAMDEELRHYVWNITSAGLPNACRYCTTRTSSKETAMRWRTAESLGFYKMIDGNCEEVYRRMGFVPFFTTERLRDLNVSSFLQYSKVPGLWV
ncbi:carbohydrate sulfotransferase 1-like [Babylonia areolata]|uniref:carbohydrate sulfotransferase 1-like n=1 Tax=Babylonia areolata TaxID=304850 RepID=UPI003FD069FC